ncbi:hypothetical protein [Ekhidna sp.]|uniref:hypothetical protein n=1 Tax=Ekhidna sp. TaxID=2608089 RepID=UPI003297BBB5
MINLMLGIRILLISTLILASIGTFSQNGGSENILNSLNKVDSLLSKNQDSLAWILLMEVEPYKDNSDEIFLKYNIFLGDYYLGEGLNIEAIKAYRELLTLSSKDFGKKDAIMLAKAINDMGIALQRTGQTRDAIDAHIKSQEIYDRYNDPQGGSYNYNNIAIIFTQLKKIDSALYFHEKSLEYSRLAYDTMGIGFNHLNMAILYSDNNDLVKALLHFQEGIKIFEQQRNDRMINALKRRLASFYLRVKDYESSLILLEDVLVYYKEKDSKTGLGGTHVALGEAFMSLEKLDTALYHLNMGISYYEPSHYVHGLTKAYLLKGSYWMEKGNIELSLQNYEKSLEISKGAHHGMTMNAFSGIAKIHLIKERYQLAINAVENGLETANYSASPGNMATSYEILYECHKALGHYALAVDYLEKYNKEKGKVFDDDQMIKLARIEYQNQLNREESERNANQTKKDLEASNKLAREKLLRYSAIVVSLLILLASVFIFRAYKIKRSANEQLTIRNAELKALRDREQQLSQESIASKERELATMAMASHEKNSVLNDLSQKISFLESRMSDELRPSLKEMQKTIKNSYSLDNSWDSFLHKFENVHPQFFDRLKDENPVLTNEDLKLSAYLKIGMSNKEIANVTHLTLGSVKSKINRLKKKLAMGPEDSLRDFMLKYA